LYANPPRKLGGIDTAGTGFTNGVFAAVPLITSSNGISATANVTIAGGIVTDFELQSGGEFWKIGNTFTLDTTIVGAGIGFVGTVTNVESNLDSIIELPEEYEEALIYNLSLRLSAMYQMEPTPTTLRLAKASLNTIRVSNTQVPALSMPPNLRGGFAYNLWNADGY